MLPTVERYIERLPRGLDSYPQACIKGAVVRGVIGDAALALPLADGMVPSIVHDILRDPPTVGAWIPEAHYNALVSAVYDLRFRDAGGMSAFERWALDGNRRLLGGPLYRVMFLVVSPERLFAGAQTRWAAFHRGSSLEVFDLEKRAAKVRLKHPPHLFPEIAIRAVVSAFRAAIEAAGARDPRIQWEKEGDAATLFRAEWL